VSFIKNACLPLLIALGVTTGVLYTTDPIGVATADLAPVAKAPRTAPLPDAGMPDASVPAVVPRSEPAPTTMTLRSAATSDEAVPAVAVAAPAPVATAAPTGPLLAPPPPPADPVKAPGDWLAVVKRWASGYGWAYAILFVVCSLLIGASARVERLRRGRAAVVLGSVVATLGSILTAKLAGFTDAFAVASGLNVAAGGVMLFIWPSRSTIDLTTATPEQIAEALQRAAMAKAPGGR
jgi:hypothetical protein